MTMEQALYRKYRPKSFNDAVGQDHITKTLQKALKAGRISHAYLFTGPRGVGKTSVARILAHEVNQLPYEADSIHLDIIEIDAASNRRIDEIRDLRDKVRVAPAAAKYKVYIIDEVHMLTREAFNALLKTLEEPPAHCIFILATTEAHKLPETIISRAQRHEFKPVNKVQMTTHLEQIAKKEKIDIDREALELLAEFGEGSFRDSIGYLDQLSSYGRKITEAEVREILGVPAADDVHNILQAIRSGDLAAVSEALQTIQNHGAGASELAAALSQQIRSDIISGSQNADDIRLLRHLVDVKASARPAEYLEISLLEAAAERSDPATKTEASISKSPDRKPSVKEARISVPAVQPRPSPNPNPEKPADNAGADFDLNLWPQVIAQAKEQAASIYTALKLAAPSIENNKLCLSFEFPLHQKKLEQSKNKILVAGIIEKLTGQRVAIECLVDKSLRPKAAADDPEPASDPVNSIANIFGAAEMIET